MVAVLLAMVLLLTAAVPAALEGVSRDSRVQRHESGDDEANTLFCHGVLRLIFTWVIRVGFG